MNTTNASSFFQSAEAQEKFNRQAAKSRNQLGDPITFSTKLLYVSPDLDDQDYILLAESGSIARRVNIVTGITSHIYRGHSAPVTCVIDLQNGKIATSSWDKTIRIYNKLSRECLAVLQGHSDFVKCLLHIPQHNLLLSGSADSHIRAWSLGDYANIYTLKGHLRGIETMTLVPDGRVYSGGSEASLRSWQVSSTSGKQVGSDGGGGGAQVVHETSIYALVFDIDSESLWSASADTTAKQFVLQGKDNVLREEASFPHADYVRALVVYKDWLITACRDENIRVWEQASGKLAYTLVGHFDEVSSLCMRGEMLISASLDATVRRWNMTKQGLEQHVLQQLAWKPDVAEKSTEDGMTADELAELEELMTDD